MRVSLIAALDRNHAIGRGNALPWHLPDDLRRFKALTLGKPVLMGRRTAQSLGRALPKRTNLVLTRGGAVPFAGMQAVASLAAVATWLPSELTAMSQICPLWPLRVFSSWPALGSQTLRTWSWPPLKRRRPSGLKATLYMRA